MAQDEGIRPNTTMEGLAKLKPAFKKGGSTTAGEIGLGAGTGGAAALQGVLWVPGASRRGVQVELFLPALRHPNACDLPLGNSSQVSDGAAALLLARRSKAEELGLPILGVLRSYAVVGVPPDIMGIGPACAIPVALQKAGKALPSHSGSGSDPCLSCCCWGWVGHVIGAEGRWGRPASLPKPLPDLTAGTRLPVWGRHTQLPLGLGWDGGLGRRVLPGGHWVSSGLSPCPQG